MLLLLRPSECLGRSHFAYCCTVGEAVSIFLLQELAYEYMNKRFTWELEAHTRRVGAWTPVAENRDW